MVAARAAATAYRGCGHDQALVYACESTVESHLGSRAILTDRAAQWLESVCDAEDLDAPAVERMRSSVRSLASTDIGANVVCIRGRQTTTSTVIHELAHVSARADDHGESFRDELIRLTRRHVSVEHAALLHSLFGACGLSVGPWPASARRP